jgi:hypothetical protein
MRLLKLAAFGAIAFAVFTFYESASWRQPAEPSGPFPRLGEQRPLNRSGSFSARRPWREPREDAVLLPRLRDESGSRRIRILPPPDQDGRFLGANERLDERPRLLPRFNGGESRWRGQR